MRDVGHGLWEQHQDLKIVGANLGTRMNVVQSEGGLFIHSSVKLVAELKAELLQIGQPKFIIAPNLFHHMFVGSYLEEFPGTEFYTIPELAKRRPDLPDPIMIENGKTYPWSGELDHLVFRGGKWFKEVIFFHRASRTLILTDFAFNIHETGSRVADLILKISKSFERFGQSTLERLLIRDRQALRQAYEQIMEWDFERISVTHGEQVEADGKQVFADGLRREL